MTADLTADLTPNTAITCPVCAKAVKTTKTGAIRQHGHTNRQGAYKRATSCVAWGCTSVREALLAAVAEAEEHAARALNAHTDRPTPRTRQTLDAAEQRLTAARKAAPSSTLTVRADAPQALCTQAEREIAEGRIRLLVTV